MKAIAVGLLRDQINHPGIRVRTIEHRTGPFDHFDSFKQIDRKGLQQVAADSALYHLPHRTPVDQDENMP